MSTDAQSASGSFGGRAHLPGPPKVSLAAAAIVAIVAAVIVVVAISSGGSSTSTANPLHLPLTKVYGHPAKNITIPEPVATPILTATAAHPVLNEQQGNYVVADLRHGASTHVFLAGPLLSRNLANNVSTHKTSLFASVPGTYEGIFTATHGTVPLSAKAFSILTYRGTVIHPRVTLASGAPLPATLPAGTTLKLRMQAKIPEGDGTIRWTPYGNRVLVGFFWTTEFD